MKSQRLIFVMLILLICTAKGWTQDLQIPIDDEARLQRITPELEKELQLFPEYPGFLDARLFRVSDSLFRLEVEYTDEGGTRKALTNMTAAEMPQSWTSVRERLSTAINYGSILRWSAALAEIEAYYRVPSADRLAVLRAFELEVPKAFAESKSIELMPVFPPILDPSQTRLLESKTTVFPFRVRIADRYLNRSELRLWHSQL